MISKILTMRKYTGGDWWDVPSATPIAAWQAKGAVSEAAAYVDLTGNGYDLEGATPTWSQADGFTTGGTAFDTLSLTLPDDISVIWAGTVLYSSTGNISLWSNSDTNWLGLAMHGYTGPKVYCGYGSSSSTSAPFTPDVDNDTTCVFCFQKTLSTGRHALYQNGTLKSEVSSIGAEATNKTARLYTGNGGFWGAVVYNGILNGTDITSISNKLNAL